VGETAVETFSYIASDGQGGSATATLSITITGTNDAPVANPVSGPGVYDDTNAVTEDSVVPVTGNVISNDSDPDGDTLSVSAVEGGAGNVGSEHDGSYGAITLNSNGTYSYELDNSNAAVQALAAGATLTETFDYTANDGNGGSATATLSITITGTNDGPVAVSDIGSGNEDVSITGNVLSNDTDVDNLVSTLTVVSNTTPAHGTLVIGSDGAYTYTPDANFNGVDSFSYTISDPGGATSSATVTLNVGAVNDAPVAADDAGSVNEDSVLTITAANGLIQSNDSDVDGNTLTVSAIRTGAESGSGTAGSVGVNLPGSLGTLNVAADGSYTYTADQAAADALGVGETSTDIFTYTISDGAGGSDSAEVIITVIGTNDGPVAVDDTGAVAEDATSTVNAASGVLSNDTDLDVSDSHEVSAIRTGGESGSGTGALVGNALVGTYGTLTMESDGSYSYTADQAAANALADGEQVTDTFTYTVSDGNGGTDSAELVITVTGTNDGPVSNPPGGTPGVDPGVYDDSDSVAEDTVAPITGDVLANDSDPDGDTLSV
ncbi:Ig-like domain-containing protein, partial [Verrucomicrobiales bacterium BCK34]|nr:Ig-like domain-containing protein [Verrucomicrobiales bacterium BCK34]